MAPRKKKKEIKPKATKVVEEKVELVEEPVIEIEEEPVEVVEEPVEVVEEPVEVVEEPLPVKETKNSRSNMAVVERIKKNAIAFSKEYFDKAKKAGCDYSASGRWQEAYGQMMVRLFGLRGKSILDIGGAFGALANAMLEAGASNATNLEISKAAIDARIFPKVNGVVAPVQHMKSVDSESFDFVHISHVLNHVDTVDLQRTLEEIKRVMKKGAKCFIIHQGKAKGDNLFPIDEKEFIELCEEVFGKIVKIDPTPADDKEYKFFKTYNWKYVVLEK